MTAAFSARRRADDFEGLLSRASDAPLTEGDAARFAALLDVVSDLRAIPDLAPRAEFVRSLREHLMTEADTVLLRRAPAPSRLAMPAPSRVRDRRVGALLGGVALVGATATMAVAAQTSLPGESLYGLKRGIESAQLRLAGDDVSRGRMLLAQAELRLSELEQLASGEGGNAVLVPDTLDAFTDQSSEGVRHLLAAHDRGGSDDEVQRARDFTATSLQRLTALQQQLPASSRDELLRGGLTLTDLDVEISRACRSCTGGISLTPDFLLSSATQDLLAGLDSDGTTLEAAPISGQDLSGITIPDDLRSPESPAPTSDPPPTTGATEVPGPKATDGADPDPDPDPDPAPDPVENGDVDGDVEGGVGDDVEGGVDDGAQDGVDDGAQDGAVDGLDGVTGGALGGLAGGVDDATGGLIDEVTGTLDPITGGTLGDTTDGPLP